jgi:hypothetical protein
MPLGDLLPLLRQDLADTDKTLFSDEILARCILRGVFRLARDLQVEITVANGEVVPEPEGETQELLLLLGRINACQYMRAATANAFSFTSGDKSVNKTSQPKNWAELEEALIAQYKLRVGQITGNVQNDDRYIITPEFRPVIYEQGLDLEPPDDLWPYY